MFRQRAPAMNCGSLSTTTAATTTTTTPPAKERGHEMTIRNRFFSSFFFPSPFFFFFFQTSRHAKRPQWRTRMKEKKKNEQEPAKFVVFYFIIQLLEKPRRIFPICFFFYHWREKTRFSFSMSPPFLPPSLHSPAPSTLTDDTAFSFRLFQQPKNVPSKKDGSPYRAEQVQSTSSIHTRR